MSNKDCYCGSGKMFDACCSPYIHNVVKAPSAAVLMRSRYSAYCTGAADYLVATTHTSTKKFHRKEDILEWSKSNQWLKLEVLKATETVVEFKAYFLDSRLKATVHHEKSSFVKEDGDWFYVDGIFY